MVWVMWKRGWVLVSRRMRSVVKVLAGSRVKIRGKRAVS